MAYKVRHEINILDQNITGATDDIHLVSLDTTKYVNPTYYFEIVAKIASGSENVTLRRKGTTTDDATIAVTSAANYTRFRSASFTGGTFEYMVHCASTNANVHSARIVIIDDISGGFTASQGQFEIGNTETALANTTDAALTNPKYWLYTAADWDGGTDFAAEVTYNRTSNMSSMTISLQQDDGAFGSWANLVTIVSAGTATAATRVRVAFTPTDGRHYRIVTKQSDTMNGTGAIYNGKIIVNSSTSKLADSYTDTANQNTQAAIDTTVNSVYGVGQAITGDGNALASIAYYISKVGSPTGTITAEIYAHTGTFGSTGKPTGSALASADATQTVASISGSYSYVSFAFTGANAITLANGTNYFVTLKITYTFNDVSNYIQWGGSTTLGHAGNAATFDNTNWASYGSADFLFKVFTTTTISKIEEQYMLLNQADTGSTGKQLYPMLWDSTEWDDSVGGLPTFKYAQDATNASDASKLVDIDNSDADVTGASASGANQQISSAFTMPTTGHQLDVNVTNTTGIVTASRVIAIFSKGVSNPGGFGGYGMSMMGAGAL